MLSRTPSQSWVQREGAMQSAPVLQITSVCRAFSLYSLTTRPLTLPLSQQRLALLLSLILLAGLVGCGPASSDHAPSLGPSASVDGPSLSKEDSAPGTDAFTPTASPLPLASVNGTGFASGPGTVPEGDNLHAMPVLTSESGHPVDGLVVPEWMAQKLNAPKVRVRLQALETWAQSAPPGAVDPFILAFEDKDERVRARAQQLLEQDWARRAEAGR